MYEAISSEFEKLMVDQYFMTRDNANIVTQSSILFEDSNKDTVVVVDDA